MLKLSRLGADVDYSTYLGGPFHAFTPVYSVVVNSSGEAYVAGSSTAGFPVTANAFQKTLGAAAVGGFVAKLNTSGTGLIASTYLAAKSSKSESFINSLAIDAHGTIYVAGITNSPSFPVKATLLPYGTETDSFVTTLDGSLSAFNYYSTYAYGNLFAVDKQLNVYVVSNRYGYPASQRPLRWASLEYGHDGRASLAGQKVGQRKGA